MEFVTSLLYLASSYISYLFIWFIVCGIAYIIAAITKKDIALSAVTGLGYIAQFIAGAIIWIWAIYIGIMLFLAGDWLWLILYVFLGYSLLMGISGILLTPILMIPALFISLSEKRANESAIASNDD